jgi:hypothetical protein
MQLIADTHLHFYPAYDTTAALRILIDGLVRLDANAVKLGFLAERSDCHFFADIRHGKLIANGEFEAKQSPEENAIIIHSKGEQILHLFAGRQIVTAERIEILALTVDVEIAERLPAEQVVQVILRANGVPVVSWAPGKWFFERGKVVERLIERFAPDQLLIGDTSLRPTAWGKPELMRKAERKGFRIIAGSDPLPFAGEEKYMGSYGTALKGSFDPVQPVTSIRKLLMSPDSQILPTGQRCGPIEVAHRLFKNAAAKR